MPNNVELCRQSVMQGVSSAVELDSDGQWMVRLQGVRPTRHTATSNDGLFVSVSVQLLQQGFIQA